MIWLLLSVSENDWSRWFDLKSPTCLLSSFSFMGGLRKSEQLNWDVKKYFCRVTYWAPLEITLRVVYMDPWMTVLQNIKEPFLTLNHDSKKTPKNPLQRTFSSVTGSYIKPLVNLWKLSEACNQRLFKFWRFSKSGNQSFFDSENVQKHRTGGYNKIKEPPRQYWKV
jgi:hypothetical protein